MNTLDFVSGILLETVVYPIFRARMTVTTMNEEEIALEVPTYSSPSETETDIIDIAGNYAIGEVGQ